MGRLQMTRDEWLDQQAQENRDMLQAMGLSGPEATAAIKLSLGVINASGLLFGSSDRAFYVAKGVAAILARTSLATEERTK